MRDPLDTPLGGVSIYNPNLLTREELIHDFSARQPLLERLLEDIRRETPARPSQHHLLVGQRGMGKTTLLRRLCFAIEDDSDLSGRWLPLTFPEEQYNVSTLATLWLNCLDALGDSLDAAKRSEAAASLDDQVSALMSLPEDKLETQALALLLSRADAEKRGLVLLLDNLDFILDRLTDEQWRFRKILSSEHRLLIIGSSTLHMEASRDYDAAFHDYFRIHELTGLTEEELSACLLKLAERGRTSHVIRLVKEHPERIRPFHTLSAGNPRTLTLLYGVLAQGEDGEVRATLESLLDNVTPLYKARIEALAKRAQQVVDAMALHWHPVTPAELAARLRIDNRQISNQLERLMQAGMVERVPAVDPESRQPLKKSAYQLSERFFNIWYLMRASRRMRRRLIWLVEFLRLVSTPNELRRRAIRQLKVPRARSRRSRERHVEYSLALAQAQAEPVLRRRLEHQALKELLEDGRWHHQMRALFDPVDDAELHTQAERMERMKDLRKELSRARIDWGQVDGAKFIEQLLGSPSRGIEGKEQLAGELGTLSQEDLAEHAKSLSDEAASLRILLGESVFDQLTEAVQDGIMSGLDDVTGAEYASHALEAPRLELVAHLFSLPRAKTFRALGQSIARCLDQDRDYVHTLIENFLTLIFTEIPTFSGCIDTHLAAVSSFSVDVICASLPIFDGDLTRAEQALRGISIEGIDKAAWIRFFKMLLDAGLADGSLQVISADTVEKLQRLITLPGIAQTEVSATHDSRSDEATDTAPPTSSVELSATMEGEGQPQTSMQRLDLAFTRLLHGQMSEANTILKCAMNQDPDLDQFVRALWSRLGLEGEPLSRAGVWTGISKRLTVYLEMAIASLLVVLGRKNEAVALMERLTHRHPDDRLLLAGYGTLLEGQGDWSEAETVRRKLTELNPGSVSAWVDLGDDLYLLDRDQEAERAYRQALTLEAESTEAWSRLGDALWMQDRNEEAEQAYRHAIDVNPANALSWRGLGGILSERGAHKEAAECFRQTLKLNPRDSFAMTRLAHLLVGLDCLEEAESLARKAITLAPHKSSPVSALANVLEYRSDVKEAEAMLRRATELDPDNSWTWSSLSQFLKRQDREGEAVDALEKALSLAPGEAVLWNSYGELLLEMERHWDAMRAFQRGVELDPGDVDGWVGLADVKEAEGRNDEAEGMYRKATEVDPKDVWAWQGLGSFLIGRGRFSEAEIALTKAAEIEPEIAPLRFLQGITFRELERFSEAEQAFRKTVTLEPKFGDAWTGLALVQLLLERTEDAERSAQRGLELVDAEDDKAALRYVLFKVHTARGDSEAARQSLDTAKELLPDEAELWAGLGDQLAEDGPPGEAEAAYRKAMMFAPNDTESRMGLADLLEDVGRLDEAARMLREARQLAPDDPKVALALSEYLFRHAQELSEAESLAREVAAKRSRDPDAALLLAVLSAEQGHWSEALLQGRRYFSLTGPDVPTRDWAETKRFFALAVQLGKAREALELVDDAGLRERWEPLREALVAASLGSRDALAAIAPELRKPAAELYDAFVRSRSTRAVS